MYVCIRLYCVRMSVFLVQQFPRDTSYNSIGSTSSLSAISDQGVVSGSSTPPNSNLSVQQANKSASQADPSSVVPIAVAFFETANVIFKPKILSE